MKNITFIFLFLGTIGFAQNLGNPATIGQTNRNQKVGKGLQVEDTLLTKGKVIFSNLVTYGSADTFLAIKNGYLVRALPSGGGGGGGGSPAGSDAQIQYNNAGAFGADAGFTRDVATGNTNISATYTGNLFKQQVNSNIESLGYEGTAMTFSDGSGNSGFRGLYIETGKGEIFVADNITLSDGTIVENKINMSSTASVTSAYNGTSFLTGVSAIASDYINIYNDVGAGNELGFFVESGVLLLGNRNGGNNTKITIDDVTQLVTISNVPTYADDAAAAIGGLTSGMLYKTTTGGITALNIVP